MTRANSSSLPFRKSTARFMTNYLTPSTAPDPSSQGSTARHSSKSSSSVLWLSVDLRWRTQFRDLAEAVKRRLTPSVSNINPLNMPASRQRCSLNILLAHPIRRRYCRFLFGRCHCLPSRWSLGLATRRQGPPDLWSGHIPDQRLGILCQFQVRNSVVSHFWEVRLWFGAWYVAEAAIILSYPEERSRGKYLAVWVMSRNLGQLVGGSISLARK
jgi:hypothetical protein